MRSEAKGTQLISVVTPVYNEEENVAELVAQLLAMFETLPYDLEIVVVNDGSDPATVAVIDRLCAAHAPVACLHLSRNFGHQAALAAGLDVARGHAVIVMDADLQHPVREIPRLLDAWEQGHAMVFTLRQPDRDVGLFKRSTSRLFYRFINRLSETPIPADAADFRLMDRQVVDALKSLPESTLFWRGLVQWVGYKSTSITFQPDARRAGDSKYNLARMMRLGADGVLSMSALPLRLALYLGALLSMVGFIYAAYVLLAFVISGHAIRGWSSLMIAVLALGGMQLWVLGIIGLYIGKVYQEIKRRPRYLVERRAGWLS